MTAPSAPKKAQILRTSRDLFWKFGFRRVTVEEICAEAGISKMTFYKYFSNKMDLVRTLMDGIMDKAIRSYREILDSNAPYPEKVVRMIQLKREQTKDMGSEFFRDYMENADPEMITYFQGKMQQNLQMVMEDFKKAREAGDIRRDINIGFLMVLMNRLIDMTHDKELLAMYDTPRDLIMEITNFLFYGILNRDVHE